MSGEYTEIELKMAEIVSKWIQYYGERGLNAKEVTPNSIICFDIVEEIKDLGDKEVPEHFKKKLEEEWDSILEVSTKNRRQSFLDRMANVFQLQERKIAQLKEKVDRLESMLEEVRRG
jgi:hypothetical protein